jgi:hypothetical protein
MAAPASGLRSRRMPPHQCHSSTQLARHSAAYLRCWEYIASHPTTGFSVKLDGVVSAVGLQVDFDDSMLQKLPLLHDVLHNTSRDEHSIQASVEMPCHAMGLVSLLILLEDAVSVKEWFDAHPDRRSVSLICSTLQVQFPNVYAFIYSGACVYIQPTLQHRSTRGWGMYVIKSLSHEFTVVPTQVGQNAWKIHEANRTVIVAAVVLINGWLRRLRTTWAAKIFTKRSSAGSKMHCDKYWTIVLLPSVMSSHPQNKNHTLLICFTSSRRGAAFFT